MGKKLNIELDLNTVYSKENICDILKQGAKLGFSYLPSASFQAEPYKSVEEFYHHLSTANSDKFDLPGGTVNFKDETFFRLYFFNQNGFLTINLFCDDCCEWTKQKPKQELEIDSPRYFKLLQEIVSPFKIKNVHVKTYYS